MVARLSSDAVNRLGLREGSAWDAAAQRMAREVESYEGALREARKMLKRRPLGTAELRRKLYEKGYGSSGAVEAAVREMERRGMLDDAAYAKLVVEHELMRRPAGRRKLAQKLMRKRLPRHVIGKAVSAAMSKRDETADARSLVEWKIGLPSFARLEPAARKRRLWGMLARRGFDHETIERALVGLVENDE